MKLRLGGKTLYVAFTIYFLSKTARTDSRIRSHSGLSFSYYSLLVVKS